MKLRVRIEFVLVFFIVLGLWGFPGLAKSEGADGAREFLRDAEDAALLYCGNKEFLAALGKSHEECLNLFLVHSGECAKVLQPLVVVSKDWELNRETFEAEKSIAMLYLLCLKARLYEDVFNVPNP